MTPFDMLDLDVWSETWGRWVPLPSQCRWFRTDPVEDLPWVNQCKDCGIYTRDDGSYISPVEIEIRRAIANEEFCEFSVQSQQPLPAWTEPPF